jgi:pyruvate dehydrogenase E2 component (dihydrolipoamide acetyltransferase)
MNVPMKLPQFGMGMSEAQIVSWLKAEGDRVEKGEPMLEIEAAKTNVEVVAPVSGIVQRILAQVGETVPVYHVVAMIDAAAEPAAIPAAPARISPRSRRLAAQGDAAPTAPAVPFVPVIADSADEQVPLTARRRLTARRMHDSLQQSAQLTLTCGMDVTALVNYRASAGGDYSLTLTDLFVRAAALALRRHPRINAVLDGETLRCLRRIDIGIAAALDDGLAVPVLRAAADLSLKELARERARLVTAVRVGSLAPSDLSGSTFTVTNLGAHGIDGFTPILNPPEIAILGVGAIHERYRRTDGASGQWRHWTTLSLTIDHRAIDGVPGALFLKSMSELCTTPDLLV